MGDRTEINQDQCYESIGFESQSQKEKLQKKSSNVQTEIVIHENEETQVVERKSAETQTVKPEVRTENVNYDSLAKFLKKVTPGILEMLDETYSTNAFNNYIVNVKRVDVSSSVKLLCRINTQDANDSKVKVSDVTWSTAGGTLAISHSKIHHETWCNDPTEILFFNILRDDTIAAVPNKILEMPSCVTTLTYHPAEPSIIAAGLFNGDVFAWNLKDDLVIGSLHVCTHNDNVTQIQWNEKLSRETSVLVSTSNDGYIYIHKITMNFSKSLPYKKFKIIKEKNPSEKSRPQSAGGKKERAAEAGLSITSFDYSVRDTNLFVIGTLCGGIYKCRSDSMTVIDEDENINDPVIGEYKRHKGSLTCIKASANKHLFVTAGTDKEIRIYDFDQISPVYIISADNTIVRITWYYGHPDIFLVYGATSNIRFFNVSTGNQLPEILLHSENRGNATCLNFNSHRELVAIGNSSGLLEIWKLPRHLRP